MYAFLHNVESFWGKRELTFVSSICSFFFSVFKFIFRIVTFVSWCKWKVKPKSKLLAQLVSSCSHRKYTPLKCRKLYSIIIFSPFTILNSYTIKELWMRDKWALCSLILIYTACKSFWKRQGLKGCKQRCSLF